jgi:glycosyltransferase involved in cell wall biosynthesis
MKKNILYLTPVFHQGGTESYIIALSTYVKSQGYNVIVVSGGGIREQQLQESNIKHIRVSQLRKKDPISLFKSIYNLNSIVKKYHIDIIHTSSLVTIVLAKIVSTINSKKIKTVYTMHGGPNRNIEKTSTFFLKHFTDEIIVLSKEAREISINNGVKREKLHLIYNGIAEKKVLSTIDKGSKKIIITCGRLCEQKSQRILIDAVSKMSSQSYEVWIIGDGELKSDLEKQIYTLSVADKVKLLGFKSNIIDYLASADIFVLPSQWEQFPISILEAMMMKLPIIASKVNGIPEEIGDSGILVNAGDSDEIAKNLDILLCNTEERKQLGNKGYIRYKTMFTNEIMGSKTVKIY